MEVEWPVRRMTNSIRPDRTASLLDNGEAWKQLAALRIGAATSVRSGREHNEGGLLVACESGGKVLWGGWRWNGRKAGYVKKGDLFQARTAFKSVMERRAAGTGVRAIIVAGKRRNGRGAKGGREVDA